MSKNIFKSLMVLVVYALLISGCEKWENHTAITDARLEKNLFQEIHENADLSKFSELLAKTGLDKEIASSKIYTVFAPTNTALASLDPAVVSDDQKLRLFVANHITAQLQSASVIEPVRLQMLSGKYNTLQGTIIEDATITRKDQYTKNGYLQIIDKALPALSNAWEFVQTNSQMPEKQKDFLTSITDPSSIYWFLQDVHDLRDEKKQYTFFVLNDAAWDTEVEKYKSFYPTGTADSTTNLASKAVVRDFAVEGVYQPSSIPDTILSKFNTKLGIDKSTIVETIKVSNGIVYVMSKLDVLPKHKFQQYIIQGEDYDFSSEDRRSVTRFRDKLNPITGTIFRDVLVFDHNIARFNLGYRLTNVPALKFKAYWVAVHDNINNNTGTFKQLLGIGSPTANLLPYTTVTPNNYNEVYLGEFTIGDFQPTLNIYLTADNSTNDDANKITVDYIRLEPVL